MGIFWTRCRVGVLVALGVAACRRELPRAACASDLACDPGEVCHNDGRCLPTEVAARFGPIGGACGVDRPGCPDGSECLRGECRGPMTSPNACPGAPNFGGLGSAFPESSTSVLLEWLPGIPARTGEGLSYAIHYGPADEPLSPTPGAATPLAAPYLVEGLTAGVAYRFRVQAIGDDGVADCNTIERVATPGPVPDCVAYPTIAPILSRCTGCHQGAAAPLGLSLDSYEGLLAGSVRGNTIVACDPSSSWLLLKLSDRPPRGAQMPKDERPLSPGQVAWLSRFVEGGALHSCEDAPVCDDPSPPTFAGLSEVKVIDARTLELHYAAGRDDRTPTESLRYDLWEGESEATLRFSDPPAKSFTGVSVIRRAVAPGARVCFAVRARDQADHRDANSVVRCATTPQADCALDFEVDVRPLLAARCTHCHGGATPRRHLRLEHYEGLRSGGALRETVRACDPEGSALVRKIEGRYCGNQMPFDGSPSLSASERSVLRGWIREGARRACTAPSPCGDATPPAFGGVASAIATEAASVELCWAPADDDRTLSDSLSYDVYEATQPGAQDFDRPAHYATTNARCLMVPAVPEAQSCWVVRARDLAGNQDQNRVERCLTPPGICLDYQAAVQATFDARCVQCHSGANAPNGLRWDSYTNVTRSSQVRPCDAGNSGLLDAIDRCQMPRDTSGERCERTACLTPAERGRIRGWIEQGASAACPSEGCR